MTFSLSFYLIYFFGFLLVLEQLDFCEKVYSGLVKPYFHWYYLKICDLEFGSIHQSALLVYLGIDVSSAFDFTREEKRIKLC